MAPVGLYTRLKQYYTGFEEPTPPAISASFAITLLVVYTFVYVIPFYLSSKTRPSPELSRDAPSVIRSRIRSVTLSCFICSVTTLSILLLVGDRSFASALHSMGYFPIGLLEAVKATTLTAILFAGPLFEAGFVDGGWRDWVSLRASHESFRSWIGWRNIVAGPVTEEVLFRSASVPLLLLAHTSNNTIIYVTPVVFGLAHVHHFYEFRITHPHTPVSAAILRSVVQFTYTTLFGGYATFLYLRTGSLLAVVLVHSFCNWNGLPRFWGVVGVSETSMQPINADDKKNDSRATKQSSINRKVVWTILYYILLCFGGVAWWRLLWPLTRGDMSLTDF